jgi:colanic acid/amylovoran biosynthesis glycosyltransferase
MLYTNLGTSYLAFFNSKGNNMNTEIDSTRRQLKVAILLSKFPCISETFILNQINYLVEQGHQVDIYSYGRDNLPAQPQVLKNDLITRTRYVENGYSRLSRVKRAVPIFLRSRKKMTLVKTINPLKFGKDGLFYTQA